MLNFLKKKTKFSKNKVLIVDDEPDYLQTLRDMLEMNRYLVASAIDGQQALKMIPEEQPDVILLDLIMPGMNGLEVLERIKSNPEFKSIPVIMLTGRSEGGDIARAQECGVDDYIVKPFNRNLLLETIKKVMEKSPKVRN